ncbi:unnamed protein product [Dibothriocephalus latus]|uniref:Uncharacterized protein n=1 Tax=Dibothriocephalus latus TaxID=60516 RepID=A0A3P7RN51_DIBLA|nr:unnamed protein product [Dibothriocephalus latus]
MSDPASEVFHEEDTPKEWIALEDDRIARVSQPALAPAPKPVDVFYLFGKDEDKDDSRWSVLRYDPRGQQPTTRIADMEGPRGGTTYSVLNDE